MPEILEVPCEDTADAEGSDDEADMETDLPFSEQWLRHFPEEERD